MSIIFPTLFLFVLCTQAISSSDLPLRFTSEQRALNPSKSNIQKQEGLAGMRPERCGRILKDRKVEESKVEGKYELSYGIRKAQRGKGATGGSNVNHRTPRSQNSAPSLSSWFSALVLQVSLGLTFLFSFHFF